MVDKTELFFTAGFLFFGVGTSLLTTSFVISALEEPNPLDGGAFIGILLIIIGGYGISKSINYFK